MGKTSFAKALAKVSGGKLLQYQCVDTTGKEQLYADVSMPAVVKRDADNSIQPGILIQAIQNANDGIKTILLIDEIDKARPEVDHYFLTFLQSGEIHIPEYGELGIDEEKRENLIVVICRNMTRELDESFKRRLRIVELDYPSPAVVNKIILSQDEEYEENIRRFVLRLYKSMYDNKEDYFRLPSVQEIIGALNDDIILKKEIKATSKERISNIVSHFSKNPEDRETLGKAIKQEFDYDLNSDNSDDSIDENDSKIPFFSLDKEEINKLIEEEYDSQNSDQDLDYDNILKGFVSKSDRAFLPENIDINKIKTIGYLKFREEQYDIPKTDKSQLKTFFKYLIDETNPNSNVAILNANEDNFIGAVFVDDTIFLISGNEVISPKQFVEAIAELGRVVAAKCKKMNSLNAYNFSTLDRFKLRNLKISFATGMSEDIAMQNILLEPKKDDEDILVGNKNGLNMQLDTNKGIVQYKQNIGGVKNLESTILDLIKLNPELRVLMSNVNYTTSKPLIKLKRKNSEYESYYMLKHICGESNLDSKYYLAWFDDADPEEIPEALINTIKMINRQVFGTKGIDLGYYIRNIPEVREYFDNLKLKAKELNNDIDNQEDISEDVEK